LYALSLRRWCALIAAPSSAADFHPTIPSKLSSRLKFVDFVCRYGNALLSSSSRIVGCYVDRWPLLPIVSRADFQKREGVISQRRAPVAAISERDDDTEVGQQCLTLSES
jgi:hypothetical protein